MQKLNNICKGILLLEIINFLKVVFLIKYKKLI